MDEKQRGEIAIKVAKYLMLNEKVFDEEDLTKSISQLAKAADILEERLRRVVRHLILERRIDRNGGFPSVLSADAAKMGVTREDLKEFFSSLMRESSVECLLAPEKPKEDAK